LQSCDLRADRLNVVDDNAEWWPGGALADASRSSANSSPGCSVTKSA
jgi:hypothetical protein